MDQFELLIEPLPWEMGATREDRPVPRGGGAAIHIVVNGRRLLDLVREVERPQAAASGRPQLAGSYEPLSRYRFDAGLFFGTATDPALLQPGGVALLGCNCGEVGCWPLVADIQVNEETVCWASLSQPFRRRWSYAALTPLTFARSDYQREVERAEREFIAVVAMDLDQQRNYELRRDAIPSWPSWSEITGISVS